MNEYYIDLLERGAKKVTVVKINHCLIGNTATFNESLIFNDRKGNWQRVLRASLHQILVLAVDSLLLDLLTYWQRARVLMDGAFPLFDARG